MKNIDTESLIPANSNPAGAAKPIDGTASGAANSTASTANAMYPVAIATDAILVLLFAALGALSHYGKVDLFLLFQIAWPFLAGLVLAHMTLRYWKVDFAKVFPHALFLTAITVSSAMLIRTFLATGTATAFIVVAFAVNTIFLVGWRLLVQIKRKYQNKSANPAV